MAADRKKKVAKYRKPFHINIGVIIFAAIFIYMIICLYLYMTDTHISAYEVKAGNLAVDNTYQGLILRQETVFQAEQAGYVNYYAREKERVANGTIVYSLDESGKTKELLASAMEEGSVLKGDNLKEIQSEIRSYGSTFDGLDFSSVYDFKYGLEGDIMELLNTSMLADLEELSQGGGGMFRTYTATQPGIIVYQVDGLEAVTPDMVTSDMFQLDQYKNTSLRAKANQIAAAGDPVYKLITDEAWSIVIPLEEDKAKELSDTDYVEVKFLDDGATAWAAFSILHQNGASFGKLDLKNSMVRYANERYIDIELMLDTVKGLKIPTSSVVEKDFFLIPLEYLTQGGEEGQEGFMKEVYDENGKASMQMVFPTIYEKSETDAYVDTADFAVGDWVVKAESQERYQIGKKASLEGVYNVNKGYAVFRQIKILYKNEEYCIVEEGTKYGLAIYDHIVLNAAAVKEDEIVY